MGATAPRAGYDPVLRTPALVDAPSLVYPPSLLPYPYPLCFTTVSVLLNRIVTDNIADTDTGTNTE